MNNLVTTIGIVGHLATSEGICTPVELGQVQISCAAAQLSSTSFGQIGRQTGRRIMGMKIIILEAGDVCQYENCEEPATAIACGKELPIGLMGHPEPDVYCDKHAKEVAEEYTPEYEECCPNCGCKFGVN